MRKSFLTICLGLFTCLTFAQTVTLKFSGRTTDMDYVQLNRVEITNLTQGWIESINWPDTVFVLGTTGINDIESTTFNLSPNNPNPFNGTTNAELMITEPGDITVELTDLNGRLVAEIHEQASLPEIYQFHINVANAGIYVLTAKQNGKKSSIKMVNNGDDNGGRDAIQCVSTDRRIAMTQNAPKFNSDMLFAVGDNMSFTGYATVGGIEKEVTINSVLQSGTHSFNFTFEAGAELTNTCPGTPTVTDYDGNVYNTVLIGNQCWMRENLKTTHFANGDAIPQENNGNMLNPTYDYPANMPNNADAYGLLYNWPAVMHGASSSDTNPSDVQGVCPNGWHVPSDAEWQEMELAIGVSSADVENMGSYRGTVAATLAGGNEGSWKNSSAENAPGNFSAENRNSTGFTALPAGAVEGADAGFKENANFWTATLHTEYNAIYRCLHYEMSGIRRYNIEKAMNFSVRCVKN